MKKIFLLLILTASYFVNAQSAKGPDKVGFANIEYIISQLPEVKQMETEMKSTQTQLKNQIQTRTKEVEKQYADFNQTMNTMTDTVRANKQRDLEKAMADLQKMQQDAQVTLQNKQKLIMAPIYLKVNRAIGEVARENGYSIILTETVSSYPFVLYHQPQMDVSSLVLKKFGVTPAAQKK